MNFEPVVDSDFNITAETNKFFKGQLKYYNKSEQRGDSLPQNEDSSGKYK